MSAAQEALWDELHDAEEPIRSENATYTLQMDMQGANRYWTIFWNNQGEGEFVAQRGDLSGNYERVNDALDSLVIELQVELGAHMIGIAGPDAAAVAS